MRKSELNMGPRNNVVVQKSKRTYIFNLMKNYTSEQKYISQKLIKKGFYQNLLSDMKRFENVLNFS